MQFHKWLWHLIIKYLTKITYFLTRGFCRLHKKAETEIIWLANGLTFRGKVLDNIRKFFSLPMALSTCIRKRAIFLVLSISDADKCFPFPQAHLLVNGGMINLALFFRRRSRIRNPLSAIISSPGRIRFRNPDSLVIYLSDTLPPHSFEMK